MCASPIALPSESARRLRRAVTLALLLAAGALAPIGSTLAAGTPAATGPARAAGDPERGRSLYEARCTGCHAQSVHNRRSRLAADFEGVREQVRRWDRNLGARWSEDEVDAVAVFLNARYYGFACPEAVCPPARSSIETPRSPLARREP